MRKKSCTLFALLDLISAILPCHHNQRDFIIRLANLIVPYLCIYHCSLPITRNEALLVPDAQSGAPLQIAFKNMSSGAVFYFSVPLLQENSITY